MALIDFYIRNQKLSKNGPAVVADTINYVDCSFTFKTRDWDGLDKWLLLEKDETYYEVNLINDAIPKEPGLTIGAGIWHVSLFGIRADGTRITTDSVTLEVKESAIPEGGPLPVISQTAAEQIAAKAEEAFAMASAVKAAADSGEFNGKDGAPGTPGEQGIPGTPGERGERGLQGIPGEDGYSPQIELSQFVDNMQKVSGVEIRVINKDGSFSYAAVHDGKNGEPGERGEQGIPGERGLPGEQGIPGEQGPAGADGFSPTVQVEVIWGTDGSPRGRIIGITDVNGTKSFSILNGDDGKDATPEQIEEALEEYFEENPIEGGSGKEGADGFGVYYTTTASDSPPLDEGANYTLFFELDKINILDGRTLQPGDFIISTQEHKMYVVGEIIGNEVWCKYLFDMQGPQGRQGPQGPQGQQGDIGPAGADGKRGTQICLAWVSPTQFVDETFGERYRFDVILVSGFPAINDFIICQPDGKLYKVYEIDEKYIWTMLQADMRGPQGEQGIQGEQGEKGERGEKGLPGNDGESITVLNVTHNSLDGGINTVQFSDGTSLQVRNGQKGSKGDKGDSGEKGEQGEKGDKGDSGEKGEKGDSGGFYVPVVINGILSWDASEDDMPDANSADIRGPKGEPGEKGEQGTQGVQGEQGEKGEPGEDGAPGANGERGTGILKITTAPSSYTTATGGFTPTYRIALSTVLTQAKAEKVLAGDTIAYSYYQYPVGYVDSSYVYLGARNSIRGATGATGPAYTLTAEDKSSIAAAVKSSLEQLTLVGTDENDVEHTWTIYGS
ncbi:MAG: collagen-like protein [Oscillospiraceae bacterium]|nr:collagen-like protein [Oscillospiraceae bacterium]